MIEMLHHGELPIHFFWPLIIHISPSRFAVVVSPPEAPEPTSGSVRPKQPIFSQRAIGGTPFRFLSSLPPPTMSGPRHRPFTATQKATTPSPPHKSPLHLSSPTTRSHPHP